jgi:hypothetical protein
VWKGTRVKAAHHSPEKTGGRIAKMIEKATYEAVEQTKTAKKPHASRGQTIKWEISMERCFPASGLL